MKSWKAVGLATLAYAVLAGGYALFSVNRGFRAIDQPSALERTVAHAMRTWSIPAEARAQKNPAKGSAGGLAAGRQQFIAKCAICHALDGSGNTEIGAATYPRVPDLRAAGTQSLTDGQLHYIIDGGVRLTAMPGWRAAHAIASFDSWKLVLAIRSFATAAGFAGASDVHSSHYVGSQACEKCHEDVYQRWKRTPMANVVRDPREHPDAIIPDLATDPFAKFAPKDVALVYGSIWKQRYFAKIGNDYYPEPAQWDIKARVWRKYFVAKGTDWWEPHYPPDNFQRPTSATCDGCHSVGLDIVTHRVAEWNVGCERCHGPGSEHVARPTHANILNPANLDFVSANDTCIQCHSQGRPLDNPIQGKYYDWPVGYEVGGRLQDHWQLEDHKLGETTFTHFADGTAHKNRMQGNDYVQSLMYHRGVTCFSCHDAHGTDHYAQLRKPAQQLCLDCHGPTSPNGPRASSIEAHTHHAANSPGSACTACHMPKIEITIPGQMVSAHTFRFITPAMSKKYQIPNACTLCHKEKSAEWAEDAMKKWPQLSPWRGL
jgi:predicted CXXCH cytochrome family protein